VIAGADVRTVELTVRLRGVEVLSGVSVGFSPGSLTTVVGPSGSGKTTLLNVLAGLQRPTTGRPEIDGAPIGSSTARIGLVHQALALLSLLTAAENVELAAQIEGRPRRDALAAAAGCLAAVDLLDRADHLVEELSSGEQQRVAIARALITEPRLLLADEPTAALDPVNRENIVALLRRTAADGTTVVVATHDADHRAARRPGDERYDGTGLVARPVGRT
jgi:putative ABC transport system ATP-binding protein